jgi:hypothetical protein
LPNGWCGKQFACHVLSQLATKPLLCFVDADVRLTPDGLARLIGQMQFQQAALISGFPLQETETLLEQMLIPLMHFLLLGFLPIVAMRRTTNPAFAAGCGQLLLVERRSYFRAGGHEAICRSRHDGITLPKAFRQAGFRTELCDLTSVATCRMYRNASEVVRGLLKNATEGLAAPARILPFTVILIGGQVLPFVLFVICLSQGRSLLVPALAMALAYLPRVISALRFRQPMLGACLHPLSIVFLLLLQWWALLRHLAGVPSSWKGRSYPAATTS